MVQPNRILTVSYGTFSCTLEGFDEPFAMMQQVAEYFRDLSSQDRYFGAEPPTPDPAMLQQIAGRTQSGPVDAEIDETRVTLRPAATVAAPVAADDAVEATETAEAPAGPFRSRRNGDESARDDEDDTAAPERISTDDILPIAAALPRRRAATPSVAEKLERIREVVERGARMAPDDEDAAEAAAGVDNTDDAASAEVAEPADAQATPEVVAKEIVAEEAKADAPAVEEPLAATEDADAEAAEAEDAVADALQAAAEEAEAAALAEAVAHSSSEDDFAGTEAMDSAEIEFPGITAGDAEAEAAPDDAGIAEAVASDDVISEEAGQAETLSEHEDGEAVRTAIETAKDAADEMEVSVGDDFEADLDAAIDGPEDVAEDEAGETEGAAIGDADAADPEERAEEKDQAVAQDMWAQDAAEAEVMADAPADAPVEEAARAPAADEDHETAEGIEALVDRDGDDQDDDDAREVAAAREIRRFTPQPDFAGIDNRAASHLDDPDHKRRTETIRVLRDAATQAVAGHQGGADEPDDEALAARVREDLRRVTGTGQAPLRRNRPAPLVLVSEQRVLDDDDADDADEIATPAQAANDAAPVADEAAYSGPGIPAEAFRESSTFNDFAERIGAEGLPELLEAAAAYTSYVEGRPRFSRAQVMSKIARINAADSFSKEAGLRSFGKLLREGKILRVQDGQFSISKSSRFALGAR